MLVLIPDHAKKTPNFLNYKLQRNLQIGGTNLKVFTNRGMIFLHILFMANPF